MVRDTSLEAYIKEQPKFLSQELKVLSIIKENPNTYDREIAESLGLEPSTIAARRNKLLELGFIQPGEKVKSVTRKTVQGWVIK